ncbi:MAG: hypothetical protein FWG36_01335 [Oscillospiraceae bacterium]|nr:hypothetical protein [Oscillospiraceae bacterium]
MDELLMVGLGNEVMKVSLIFSFIAIIAVVLIIVIGQAYKARLSAISKNSFEELTTKLTVEIEAVKAELADMNESLSSINKMMKEIE